jgi:predicted Rossmann-fold nucleotide-binding protein
VETVEVETLAEFDAVMAASPRLRGVLVQSVDLTARDRELLRSKPRGAVFLGCAINPRAESYLLRQGALIFPRLPDLPFDAYRSSLYSPQELYEGLAQGYVHTADALVYAWTRAQTLPRALTATMAMSLHDHSISDALDEALGGVDPRLTVGVMGGHALLRTDDTYRDAAVLGARLTARGRTILTGGGPGAMEAANLGAYLAGRPDTLPDALAMLTTAPSFKAAGIDAWAATAQSVREAHPDGRAGFGIPTWFYGHEPPNLFANQIAKYFSNALREDTLLARCRGGIVYLPGAAGTVQEIFQAVTEIYYATDPARLAPLVLVGRDQWTTKLPAWPLLRRLAKGRPMESMIHLVDTVAEAESVLLGTDA